METIITVKIAGHEKGVFFSAKKTFRFPESIVFSNTKIKISLRKGQYVRISPDIQHYDAQHKALILDGGLYEQILETREDAYKAASALSDNGWDVHAFDEKNLHWLDEGWPY